ncbi:MAG: hypothetical protein A2095_01205 [Sphingomonadales bacterium GWF1_63_6]|nr:MAG: hypothetical protein A2095_01205 [Sphingomonadales bacterium GWF1_63_6]
MGEPMNVESILKGLIDELAAVEHERWSHWQRYMHSKGVRQADGSLILPSELVERWERQAVTDYYSLPETEQESDREQVNRYLPIIAAALGVQL